MEYAVGGICLFIIIFFAVRLAIAPLLGELNNKKENIHRDNSSIMDLRNIGIFNYTEINEIMKIYSERGKQNKRNDKFHKYANILKELNELGYLEDEQYKVKLEQLENHYNL